MFIIAYYIHLITDVNMSYKFNRNIQKKRFLIYFLTFYGFLLILVLLMDIKGILEKKIEGIK